jgi:hypothetical protein
MTGMTANSQTTGSDMEWQNFIYWTPTEPLKNLEKDGFVIEITGTYNGLILQKYCIDLDL